MGYIVLITCFQDGFLSLDVNLTDRLLQSPISFNGRLKESKEFIDVLDYGVTLLSPDNIVLKMEMLSLIIKKTRTLEKLMELGTKHAVQSSLYNLEQNGFITRKVKENIFSYEFNRTKILFKIKKDLETRYQQIKDVKDYYISNDCLFVCSHCKQLFDYAKAMEHGFICCGARISSFDSTSIVQNLMDKMVFIEEKLKALSKI